MQILPIVEGDGDIAAVPELVRRVAYDHGRYDISTLRPHKRGDLPKVLKRFEDFFLTAALEEAPVLWVMDYDCEDCSDEAKHVKQLRARAAASSDSVPIEFVFMVKEFESLFLADEKATRAVFTDIPLQTVFPHDPETVRDAKGITLRL